MEVLIYMAAIVAAFIILAWTLDYDNEQEDKIMNQYWIRTKHNGPVGCTNPLWQLTRGKFRNEEAVYKAYEAQAKALDYEILEAKPHEQFEFRLED